MSSGPDPRRYRPPAGTPTARRLLAAGFRGVRFREGELLVTVGIVPPGEPEEGEDWLDRMRLLSASVVGVDGDRLTLRHDAFTLSVSVSAAGARQREVKAEIDELLGAEEGWI